MVIALLTPQTTIRTMADVFDSLGVGADRVRAYPPPGSATKQDLVEAARLDGRPYELVDGVLVEKVMGFRESCLAGAILELLRHFVVPKNLGLVSGGQGMMQLFPGLVRGPDVAFVSWAHVPGGSMPVQPIPSLVPDLAIEVLSASNRGVEMTRKRQEYFSAGCRIVWEIDPDARTVSVYSAPQQFTTLSECDTLLGGDVLVGFTVLVRELLAELDRQASS
jgi:Uma2 family endonuclease